MSCRVIREIIVRSCVFPDMHASLPLPRVEMLYAYLGPKIEGKPTPKRPTPSNQCSRWHAFCHEISGNLPPRRQSIDQSSDATRPPQDPPQAEFRVVHVAGGSCSVVPRKKLTLQPVSLAQGSGSNQHLTSIAALGYFCGPLSGERDSIRWNAVEP